ncbi:MAG: hypothetical protein ACON3Z_07770 [Bradymonadia bacterium]
MRHQSPNRLIHTALLCLLCACSSSKQSDQKTNGVSNGVTVDTKKGFEVKVRAPLFMPDAGSNAEPAQTIEAPDTLLGQWVLDKEAVKGSKLFKAIPEDKRKSALDALEASKVNLRITKNDISMIGVFLGQDQNQVVGYRLTGKEGNNYVAQILIDGQKREQRFLVRGQKLVIRTEGTPLFFTRSETKP